MIRDTKLINIIKTMNYSGCTFHVRALD